MATTKIWKIKNRFDHVIDYATNEKKTDNQKYVTGINCMTDIAHKEMNIVKQQFSKNNGILGYHAYQSFSGYEVTSDEAHEIGIKLAEEIWGDRFQVIVTTHLNTKNIHNHFVINSVSFIDGKKYYDSKKSYALIRKTSDDICSEHGLNIVEEKDFYKNCNKRFERNDFYTNTVREDICFAIGQAYSYKDFERILEKMGYILTYRNEILSLRKEPYKRNIRIVRTFGKDYSRDMIISRVQNTRAVRIPFPEVCSLIGRYKSKYKYNIRTKKKPRGLIALYWYYRYLLKITPPNKYPPKLSEFMKKEVKKMDEISTENRFLAKNNIYTLDILNKFKDESSMKLNELKSTRENLWRKYHRTTVEDKRESILLEIQRLGVEIRKIDIDIKMCKNIYKRSLKIKEAISEMNIQNKVVKEKKKDGHAR